jgi:hypothetical protein
MFNKKADAGARWYILLLAAVASLISCLFSSAISDVVIIPKVGEFPIALHTSLEQNNNINSITDNIMKQISKQTIDDLNLGSTSEFEDTFEERYDQFKENKPEDFNLDFFFFLYEFSVENEKGEFFIKGITDNDLEIPMKLTEKYGRSEKQIGRVWINPSFKIPIDHDFI